MKKLFYKNIAFFAPYFLIIICLMYVIIVYEKIDIHIFINSYHNNSFDVFFKYLTYLGDGYSALILTIILLFINLKWSIISAVSNFLTLIFVQASKLLIFSEFNRPKFYFDYFYEGDHVIHLIEGAIPGIRYSFPSGHSATAFAIFLLIAFLVKNNFLKTTLLICAILIAFSRIYLSWHFLQDTIAGSLYGIIITFFVFFILDKKVNDKYNKSIFIFEKRKK